MFASEMIQKASRTLSLLKDASLSLITAESCTGGMIGTIFTSIPGSSENYAGGFVVYDNLMKIHALNISMDIIHTYGAVSFECCTAMATGCVESTSFLQKDRLGMAVTGIAGPGGGTNKKPVGLVYIGMANQKGIITTQEFHFKGDRQDIRLQASEKCLDMINDYLSLKI